MAGLGPSSKPILLDTFINVLVDELNKLKDNDTVEGIDEVNDYLNPKTISETNENSSKRFTRNK